MTGREHQGLFGNFILHLAACQIHHVPQENLFIPLFTQSSAIKGNCRWQLDNRIWSKHKFALANIRWVIDDLPA